MMMEQRIAELVARAERAERERDAAVADLLGAEEAVEREERLVVPPEKD